MMSLNSYVPPICVPPGYFPQVIVDNGVRRVIVVPQAPEFHPGGHIVIYLSPHSFLSGFIPVPIMMPPPPGHVYSPVTGAGDSYSISLHKCRKMQILTLYMEGPSIKKSKVILVMFMDT